MNLYKKLDDIVEQGDEKELQAFNRSMVFKNWFMFFMLSTVSTMLGMMMYDSVYTLNAIAGIDMSLWNIIIAIIIILIVNLYALIKYEARFKDEKFGKEDVADHIRLTLIMSGGLSVGCYIAAKLFY